MDIKSVARYLVTVLLGFLIGFHQCSYASTGASRVPAINPYVAVAGVAVLAGVGALIVNLMNRNNNNGSDPAVASPSTPSYTISGKVTGLAPGVSLILQNNDPDSITVTANKPAFAFPTQISSGMTYNVAVQTQPTGQICTVVNNSGTVGSGDVTNVVVSCVNKPYSVGGIVTGLVSTESVTLQNNGGNDLVVSGNGDGTFVFGSSYRSSYAVSVSVQPAGQMCTVTNESGTVGVGGVTNVVVECTDNSYTVRGTVTNLISTGSVTLQNNGGNDLAVSGNGDGTFAFSNLYDSPYDVTILESGQPVGQTCTVTHGNGTVGIGGVTNVVVSCINNPYSIGGAVTGLSPTGSVTLQNNGGNDLTVNGDGTFAFSSFYSLPYAITIPVSGQPTGQTCAVANNSGTVGSGDITNVEVTCTDNPYTIGGTVTGLDLGASLILKNNNGDKLNVSTNGSFTFLNTMSYGSNYVVTMLTPPVGQTCTVTDGNGTVTGNVNKIDVLCETNTFEIVGEVSGLASGKSVTLSNGGSSISVATNGRFIFSGVPYGSDYDVLVSTQPQGQICRVSGGAGKITGEVNGVTVTCV